MRFWRILCVMIVAPAALSACDFGRPPEPERGANVPASAKLVFWPKIGWGWELCLDGPSGSALLSWGGSASGGPFITVHQLDCVAVDGHDRRDDLRVESERLEFLFPEAPDTGGLLGKTMPCPRTIPREALTSFEATLNAAAKSGELTPGAIVAANEMVASLTNMKPERLWLAGGRGNMDAWSIACADISHVIPETNPDFPDHLKSGR